MDTDLFRFYPRPSAFIRGKKLLQVSSAALFFLYRHKQRLKITFAEALAAFALEDFVEDGWAVFDGFGEDLKQVAFFVAVDEDAEFFEAFDVFVDLADA